MNFPDKSFCEHRFQNLDANRAASSFTELASLELFNPVQSFAPGSSPNRQAEAYDILQPVNRTEPQTIRADSRSREFSINQFCNSGIFTDLRILLQIFENERQRILQQEIKNGQITFEQSDREKPFELPHLRANFSSEQLTAAEELKRRSEQKRLLEKAMPLCTSSWLEHLPVLEIHNCRKEKPEPRQTATGSKSREKHSDKAESSNLEKQIAKAAEHRARSVGSVGYCYREVANTLDQFGVHLVGRSAYMAAPQLSRNKHFKEIAPNHMKRGTILVFGPSSEHPHGHITVYLGGGMEASDHVQGLVNFSHYSKVRAFRPLS